MELPELVTPFEDCVLVDCVRVSKDMVLVALRSLGRPPLGRLKAVCVEAEELVFSLLGSL